MPAFEIGCTHLRVCEQFRAGATECGDTIDHHITAMRQFQGMVGVLLNEENGQSFFLIEIADRIAEERFARRTKALEGAL